MQSSVPALIIPLLLTLTVVGVLYLLTIWQFAKRRSTSALLGSWIGTSLLLPALLVGRVYLQLNRAGGRPSVRFLVFNLALACTLCLLSLGAATLSTWRYMRRPAVALGRVRVFFAGFVAYWAAILVWFVLAALLIDLQHMKMF